MRRICVKAFGFFKETICLDLEECVSVEDLITMVFNLKGVRASMEAIAVSDGTKTLKLSENACLYEELIIFRLFHGG